MGMHACPTARSGGLSLRAGLAAGEGPLGSGVGLSLSPQLLLVRPICRLWQGLQVSPVATQHCAAVQLHQVRPGLYEPANHFHPFSPSFLALTSWPDVKWCKWTCGSLNSLFCCTIPLEVVRANCSMGKTSGLVYVIRRYTQYTH